MSDFANTVEKQVLDILDCSPPEWRDAVPIKPKEKKIDPSNDWSWIDIKNYWKTLPPLDSEVSAALMILLTHPTFPSPVTDAAQLFIDQQIGKGDE